MNKQIDLRCSEPSLVDSPLEIRGSSYSNPELHTPDMSNGYSKPVGCYYIPSVIEDSRILNCLLQSELSYVPSANYISSFQTEITSEMRTILAKWMYEVTEEQKCDASVFPLSLNLLDRFLCIVRVKKSQYQMLGAVCMLIASKIRHTFPMDAYIASAYTDHSVSSEEILCWESVIINKLNWDVCGIVSIDFLDPIIYQLKFKEEIRQIILKQTIFYIVLAAMDYSFMRYSPSTIAVISIASAISKLPIPSDIKCSLNINLMKLTNLDMELFNIIFDQMSQLYHRYIVSKNENSAPVKDEVYDKQRENHVTPSDIESINM